MTGPLKLNLRLIIILFLMLSACAENKNVVSPQKTTGESRISDQARTQIKHHISDGDYQKAIDVYRTEYKKHQKDEAFVKEYIKDLEEMKSAADKASAGNDFGFAGKTYSILSKYYAEFKPFSHSLSFDKSYLNNKIAACKTALSRRGFQAYREGKLKDAISIWEDYLEIDPGNQDIRRALNTAKTQQKNL